MNAPPPALETGSGPVHRRQGAGGLFASAGPGRKILTLLWPYFKLLAFGAAFFVVARTPPVKLLPFLRFNILCFLPLLLLPSLLRSARINVRSAFIFVALVSYPFDSMGWVLLDQSFHPKLFDVFYQAFFTAAAQDLEPTSEVIMGLVERQTTEIRLELLLYELTPVFYAACAWFLLTRERRQAPSG